MFLCGYYCNGVLIVANVMRQGKCPGLEGPACFRALVQRLVGAIFFGWYVCAVMYTTYHIDIIDQHIQFSKDLAALSKARELVDKLDERELAPEDSSYSLWQKLTNALAKQDELVYDFF